MIKLAGEKKVRTDQRELREEEFFFCSKLEVFLKLLLSFRSFLTSGSFLPYERIKSVFSKKKIKRKPPPLSLHEQLSLR